MSRLRRLALEHQDRPLICDCGFPTELRARTASFKWQVSPLLLYSLPWHRARTEPSRKVSCQSASCRATLFGGSREKCFAFRSRSVDGTEFVTSAFLPYHFSRWPPLLSSLVLPVRRVTSSWVTCGNWPTTGPAFASAVRTTSV